MLEKDIEKKHKKKIEAAGGKLLKFVCPGNAGVPDRIELLPGGKIRFMEFKRPGENPTPLQKFWLKKLNELGFEAIVYDGQERV